MTTSTHTQDVLASSIINTTLLYYTGEALDAIIEEALGLQQDPEGGGKGILASIGSTISSLQRFSRSLSR